MGGGSNSMIYDPQYNTNNYNVTTYHIDTDYNTLENFVPSVFIGSWKHYSDNVFRLYCCTANGLTILDLQFEQSESNYISFYIINAFLPNGSKLSRNFYAMPSDQFFQVKEFLVNMIKSVTPTLDN